MGLKLFKTEASKEGFRCVQTPSVFPLFVCFLHVLWLPLHFYAKYSRAKQGYLYGKAEPYKF